MKYLIIFTVSFFVISVSAIAHDGDKHDQKNKKEGTTEVIDSAANGEVHEHEHIEHEAEKPFSTTVNPGWSDFPSMHPMVVHFPVVLLLIALLTQFAAFFIWKEELSMVTLCLLAGGAIGAWVASNFAHPHTAGLNEVASQLLTLHEQYAGYTKWLSIVALGLKAISHFVLKRKLWGEILVALIMAGSAYSVSQAGHYGAALTHLHGVGVEGKYLENESHDHDH